MDASDPDCTAFAVVCDVAATWHDYHPIRRAVDGSAVSGLILHAAGPTDEGFRTIDVWACEDAWHRYRLRLGQAFDHLAMPPAVRELRVGHLVSSPTASDRSHPHDPRT